MDRPTVYKIFCKDAQITDIYIGSTYRFKQRQSEHKYASKIRNTIVHKFIRDNGGWDNWNMLPIRKYKPDMTRDELVMKEKKYAKKYESTLNKCIPGRTKKEYDKEYRQINRELINQKRRMRLIK